MVFSVASADRVLLPVTLWKVGAHSASVEYGFCMRTAPALLISALVALTLVACVPDDEPVRPEPSPSSSPIFESDEEALAAAEEAYGAYVELSDQILAEGGSNPERISELVSSSIRQEVLDGFGLYAQSGWHTSGRSTFDSVQLQQYVPTSDDFASIVMYMCADVSQVRILDVDENDVTPAGRPERVPLEVEITFSSDSEAVIERSDLWSGDDFCTAA